MQKKKAKSTKKCVIKRKVKFEDYENCLEVVQTEDTMDNLKTKTKLMQIVLKKIKKNS